MYSWVIWSSRAWEVWLKAGEERGDGLADLEVDGAFLGLDDDIGGEFAVERVEDVVSGAGAVGFGVAPVEVVVVDEGAVEDDPPRGARAAARVLAASAGVRPKLEGPGWPSESALTVKPAKSGISA